MTINRIEEIRLEKKPQWLKVKFPSQPAFFSVSSLLKEVGLNTICQSAKCPNQAECWSQKTATFLILGNICTRRCSFCAVSKGIPSSLSPDEPERVAKAVDWLGLSYAVITSVTRDDLMDGGASQFAGTIKAIRNKAPQVKIEALIPDFNGDEQALALVVAAKPDLISHNLETIGVLYPQINRPVMNYQRSLNILAKAKEKGALTKSGLMVGLGETEEELIQSFKDLRCVSCDLLTIGQYLRPSPSHSPVQKYYSPQEFDRLREIALAFGFKSIVSGPLVRSSYHAQKMYESCLKSGIR